MQATTTPSAISAGQLKMIYGLARRASVDNDTLHALVRSLTRKDSIKALTSYEAKRVIDRLQVLAGQEKTSQPNRATGDQIVYIYGLEKKLGWREDPQRLRAWLEKRYKVSHARFLSDTDARKCIEAMKAMLAGGRGERKKTDDDVQ